MLPISLILVKKLISLVPLNISHLLSLRLYQLPFILDEEHMLLLYIIRVVGVVGVWVGHEEGEAADWTSG